MGIYSLKNKVLNEEKDWSDDNTLELNLEIEFDDNKNLIFRTGDDMIWQGATMIISESSIHPDIKFNYTKNQPMKINIVPLEINGVRMKHGARIKIKRFSNNKSTITKSLKFDQDSNGNTIASVSDYKNQDKNLVCLIINLNIQMI